MNSLFKYGLLAVAARSNSYETPAARSEECDARRDCNHKGDGFFCNDSGDCEFKCDESKWGPNGTLYRGCANKTETGLECREWDTLNSVKPPDYPNGGISKHHNYCRNPDNSERGLWCYTRSFREEGEGPRWEKCAKKFGDKNKREGCDSHEDCSNGSGCFGGHCKSCDESKFGPNGQDYRGCQNKTKTGLKCRPWDENNKVKPSDPDVKGIDEIHSYCRNPDNSENTIWCYTESHYEEKEGPRWEHCEKKDVCQLCSRNDCLGNGACLLIEDNGEFTCEIDPSHFTSQSVCDSDYGHWCEKCDKSEDIFEEEDLF